jgi:citrate lyase beta subunit
MKTSLSEVALCGVGARLAHANRAFAERFPGEPEGRRPVHTVYGGAHLFSADAARKLGALALRAMDEHASDSASLAEVAGLGGPDDHALTVYDRVRAKLRAEPVEDFRIDFEDGYGIRPAEEEDRHASLAAAEVAKGMAAGSLPPFLGIRIKSFTEELRARSVRTLDLFLTSLCEATQGKLPPNFVVTLPKVTIPEQVAALADLFDLLEPALGIPSGELKIELMVEAPQAIFDAGGQVALPNLVRAARGRCSGAHFGAYDYTAALGIASSEQRLSHPACDFARDVMLIALSGSGIALSDGATNILPVPIHRSPAGGAPLTEAARRENSAAVRAAWRLHFSDVQRSLSRGFYQGWDLHPAQLVTRYAALYDFFLRGLPDAAVRLRRFVERAAQATLAGSIFDDAATGQGLLNYFLRAIGCGALSEAEAQAQTGLSLDDLRSRSFSAIIGRRAAAAAPA